MIFFKHFVLLALLYTAVPLLARAFGNRAQRAAGVAPVPFDRAYILQSVLLGCLFPLAAQGGFQLCTALGIGPMAARLVSLGVVSLGFGAFLAMQEYVHGWWAVCLALAGGIGTALLYGVLPYNEATQALLAVCLTALPILAVEMPGGPMPRLLFCGRVVLPIRGYLR